MKYILAFLVCIITGVACIAQPYPDSFLVDAHGGGQFRTIQEAVNAVRDLSQQRVTIHIRNGVYHEKLWIPSWKNNIRLLGESRDSVIITNSDFSGKAYPGGRDPFGKTQYSTYTSYTMLVQGNDFIAENLVIRNEAGRVGQAVALHVEGDRALVLHCRILGNQDTLYMATEGSRQYYRDCFIEGTTDFIFGEATAVFENCTIRSLSNSYITAAATPANQPFGFVFLHCRLEADTVAKKVYLGRPWRPHARTVFIETEMGAHILPAGWDNWRNAENEKTASYAEYKNTGPGAVTSGRVKWSKQLSAKQAKRYTAKQIFGDWKIPVL
jgi:pectinesterase